MSEPRTIRVSSAAIKALERGGGIFLVSPWAVEAGDLVRLQAGELTGVYRVHSAAASSAGCWQLRIGGEG
jgi:hypothetical protein